MKHSNNKFLCHTLNFLSLLLIGIAISIKYCYIPIYFENTINPIIINYSLTIFFLGFFLCGFIFHQIRSKWTLKITYLCFGITIIASTLLENALSSSYLFIPLYLLDGICLSGLIYIHQNLLLKAAGKETSVLLALFITTLAISFIIPFFPFLIFSFPPQQLVISLVLLSILHISLINRKFHPTISTNFSLLKIIKIYPLPMFTALCIGIIFGFYLLLGGNLCNTPISNNLDAMIVQVIPFLAGIIIQLPFAILSKYFSTKKLRILITFVLFFSNIMAIYLGFLSLFLQGASLFTLYPITLTNCAKYYPAEHIPSISNSILQLFGLGSMIGLLFAKYSIHLFGPLGSYYFISCVTFSLFFSLCRQNILKFRTPHP